MVGKSLQPWWVLFAVSMTGTMELWDIHGTNIAIRHVAGGLSVSNNQALWVLTSYIVATAVAMPMSARLSNVMGRRPCFLICVGVFTLGSLLTSVSQDFTQILCFSALKGLGGGAMTPTGEAMILNAFEPKRRGLPLSIYMSSYVLGIILGSMIGGNLAETYSWRAIFFLSFLVGTASLIVTWLAVENEPDRFASEEPVWAAWRINYPGYLALVFGVGSLQIVLDRGQIADWFHSPVIVNLTLLGLVGLALGILSNLRHRQPLVMLSLLRDRCFLIGCIYIALIYALSYGSMTLLPSMLTDVMDYPPSTTGHLLAYAGMGVLVVLPIFGILQDRGLHPRWLVLVGGLLAVWGLWQMTNFSADLSPEHVILPRAAQQAGVMIMASALFSLAFQTLPTRRLNEASSIFNMVRMGAASSGIALANTFIMRQTPFHQEQLAPMVHHLNEQSQYYLQQLEKAAVRAGVSPADAPEQSFAFAYHYMQKQAMLFAYVEAFWLFCLITLASLSLLVLMQSRTSSTTSETKSTGN